MEEFCLTFLVLGSRSTLLHSQPLQEQNGQVTIVYRCHSLSGRLLLWQRDAEGGPEATHDYFRFHSGGGGTSGLEERWGRFRRVSRKRVFVVPVFVFFKTRVYKYGGGWSSSSSSGRPAFGLMSAASGVAPVFPAAAPGPSAWVFGHQRVERRTSD